MVKNIWEKPVKSMDHIEILNIKLKRFKKHVRAGVQFFSNNKSKMELKNELLVLEILDENGEFSIEVSTQGLYSR
jgi:hypothetical protein